AQVFLQAAYLIGFCYSTSSIGYRKSDGFYRRSKNPQGGPSPSESVIISWIRRISRRGKKTAGRRKSPWQRAS
ncbi:hypothetical protein GBAR_LOCUS4741, partial [Geodia barretti]